MSKAHPPELKKFMDKKLSIKLNAGRAVTGVLRGFDPFMNLVLDESVEECKDGQRNNIGMVVRKYDCFINTSIANIFVQCYAAIIANNIKPFVAEYTNEQNI